MEAIVAWTAVAVVAIAVVSWETDTGMEEISGLHKAMLVTFPLQCQIPHL